MSQAAKTQAPLQVYRGIVKQVISGDCLVIRSGALKDGKFLEKQIMLSNVQAPRLAKRTGTQATEFVTENDQVRMKN